jgi:cystathionine beta-synthase
MEKQGDKFAGKNVLIVLPDSGNRYLSKVYDDDWMREAGFLDRPSLGTVSDLLHVVKPKGASLIMVKQNDKVSTVIEHMRDKGFSQMPVVDDVGWIKGLVTEGSILNAIYEGRVKSTDTLERLVDASIEFVSLGDPIEKVTHLVTAGRAALVSDANKPGGILAIITKIDLLTYLGNLK